VTRGRPHIHFTMTTFLRIAGTVSRPPLLLACALVLLLCTGCMKVITEVFVKKDGSGTVCETVYLDKMVIDLARSLGDRDEDVLPKVDKVKGIKRAQEMGKGVRYVASEPLRNAHGDYGMKTVFAFDDVRTLKVGVQPESLAAEISNEAMEQQSRRMSEPLTFDFEAGKKPTLIVYLPQPADSSVPAGRDSAGAEHQGDDAAWDATSGEARGVLDMLRGFGVWLRVRVEGTIVETNAGHVNAKKDGLTVVRIDFAQFFEAAEKTGTLIDLSALEDLTSLRRAAKGMPGMMLQDSARISITFE